MMKIHTTQNLTTLGTTIKSTNVVLSKDIRYNDGLTKPDYSNDVFESSTVNFKGKGDIHKISRFFDKKKNKIREDAVKRHKQVVEEMASGESFSSKSKTIDVILDAVGHEVVAQAAIAFLICTLLRPSAIMLLPNKKDKRDNMYAAAHSVSSGILSVLTAILISYPFSHGLKTFNEKFIGELPLTMLKQLFPDLNTKSVINEAKLPETISKIKAEAEKLKFQNGKSLNEILNGKSLDEIINTIVNKGKVEDEKFWTTKDGKKLAEVINNNIKTIVKEDSQWKFIDGNSFMSGIDSVQLMPSTVLISEIINPKTLEHYGINTDVKKIEEYMKAHNNSLVGMKVQTNEGEKKLIDALPVNDMTLAIENLGDDHYAELGYENITFYPIYHIDKNFLKEVVDKNTNNDVIKKLDVEKAFDANGKLKHPKDWVDKNGNQIENYESLVDYLGISTAYESDRVMPVHTGVLREEGKLASFLPNVKNDNLSGVPSEIGTMVTKEAIAASSTNDMRKKLVTWMPDILTRVPVGFGTIALVPIVLKKLFNLEKTSPKPPVQTEQLHSVQTSGKEVA